MTGLVLLHHGEVGVLQARAPDLEVVDVVVLRQQLPDERDRVRGRLLEPFPVAAPRDPRLARGAAGQLVRAAVGDDPAGREDQDPVGELLRLVQVVGGQQDRGVLQLREPVHQLVELAAGVWVESGRRLVEEQQLGAADDADRHVEAAPLASGKRHDLLVRVLVQPHHREQLVDVARAGALRRRIGLVVPAEMAQQPARRPARMVTP
jgi:hypothetical protein